MKNLNTISTDEYWCWDNLEEDYKFDKLSSRCRAVLQDRYNSGLILSKEYRKLKLRNEELEAKDELIAEIFKNLMRLANAFNKIYNNE